MAAALTETKTLKGVVKLSPIQATKYFFELQQLSGTKLPNALDNVVLEEVFINIDTTPGANVIIYLPAISTFNLAWNAKIYITWLAGVPKPSIYSYEGTEIPLTLPDFINGIDGFSMESQGQTALLRITEEHNWAYFSTSIPA